MLLGCRTNAGYLRRLLADADVRKGNFHTGTIAEKPELAADTPLDGMAKARLLAAASLVLRPVRDAADAVPTIHAAIGGWGN